MKSDELLDLYTNRPFGKVFHALDKVGERLRHLWADVATPFFDVLKETKTTLSRHTIRRVQFMKRQGFKMSAIAESLAISIEAARHAARQSVADEPSLGHKEN